MISFTLDDITLAALYKCNFVVLSQVNKIPLMANKFH